MLATQGTLGLGGALRAHARALREAGQSLAPEAPPPRAAAGFAAVGTLAVRVLLSVTGSEMAADSGDRETACTVRADALGGSLAGQRATPPRGDREPEKGAEGRSGHREWGDLGTRRRGKCDSGRVLGFHVGGRRPETTG